MASRQVDARIAKCCLVNGARIPPRVPSSSDPLAAAIEEGRVHTIELIL